MQICDGSSDSAISGRAPAQTLLQLALVGRFERIALDKGWFELRAQGFEANSPGQNDEAGHMDFDHNHTL